MRLIPLHNNLIVEPFQLGEISRGGLLIPQVAKASTPYRYGKVLDVGPGRVTADGKTVPVNIECGAIIAYAKNAGVEFPLDDAAGNEQTLLLLGEQYVLGIIKDMPEQSRLTGLDGRLLMMQPGSRAISDGALAAIDDHARVRREGFIDSSGTYLDDIAATDRAEAEAE